MSWVVEHLHANGTVAARVALQGMQLRIGRALDNDLVLDDPHCAPFHAVLRIDEQGQARLHDLGTVNGIRLGSGWRRPKRVDVHTVTDDRKIQLGGTSIRVRHADWPLAAEKPLSTRPVWPYAALALALVLLYSLWRTWLRDVHETSPLYLADSIGTAVAIAVWSSFYALLGRLLGGVDRFFTHLLIASCAFLLAALLDHVLDALAFAFYWLWPLRISSYAMVVVVALTIRAHLRVADARHWPVLRWGLAVGTLLAIAVPLAQTWMSSKRLTNIQVMSKIEHPALRVAKPVPVDQFMQALTKVRNRADAQRESDARDSLMGGYDEDD